MKEKRKPKQGEFMAVIAKMQEAMKPVFDRQRAIEDAECPARLETLQRMHVSIDQAGGNCPVQIDGHVKGQPFYFRARGDAWSLGIGGDPVSSPAWSIERDYGAWPDAGWMPLHEAYDFLIAGIGEWRPKLRAEAQPNTYRGEE